MVLMGSTRAGATADYASQLRAIIPFDLISAIAFFCDFTYTIIALIITLQR